MSQTAGKITSKGKIAEFDAIIVTLEECSSHHQRFRLRDLEPDQPAWARTHLKVPESLN